MNFGPFARTMSDSNAPPPVNSKPTILVVDDEDAIRDFVRFALEHAGYAVVPARDGEEAEQLFHATPHRFSLVLSDVVMPNGTGTDLVTAIRRIDPKVRVLFMTGFAATATLEPLVLPPDTPVIAKPFSLDQLLRAVASALASKP
jgi:DNA-binding NtrC family response regulator